MLRVLLLLSSIFLTLSWASLKKEILSNYSRTELPPDSPIKVSLSLALYQLINFDVKTQSVFCLFWQRASWKDSRLAWRNYKIGTGEETFFFDRVIGIADSRNDSVFSQRFLDEMCSAFPLAFAL